MASRKTIDRAVSGMRRASKLERRAKTKEALNELAPLGAQIIPHLGKYTTDLNNKLTRLVNTRQFQQTLKGVTPNPGPQSGFLSKAKGRKKK